MICATRGKNGFSCLLRTYVLRRSNASSVKAGTWFEVQARRVPRPGLCAVSACALGGTGAGWLAGTGAGESLPNRERLPAAVPAPTEATPTGCSAALTEAPPAGALGAPGWGHPFLSALNPVRAEQAVSCGSSPAVRLGVRALWNLPGSCTREAGLDPPSPARLASRRADGRREGASGRGCAGRGRALSIESVARLARPTLGRFAPSL